MLVDVHTYLQVVADNFGNVLAFPERYVYTSGNMCSLSYMYNSKHLLVAYTDTFPPLSLLSLI